MQFNIIELLQYLKAQEKTQNPNHRNRRGKGPKKFFDPMKSPAERIVAEIDNRKKEIKILEEYMKAQTKPKDDPKIRNFTSLEWFIFGIVAYMFFGPAGTLLVKAINTPIPGITP